MNQHHCKYDELIPIIKDDLREVKSDVKKLLALKYQIFGVVAVLILILNLVVSFLTGNRS